MEHKYSTIALLLFGGIFFIFLIGAELLSDFDNDVGFITNLTMNKTVSCFNIIGSDADFCIDSTGGEGSYNDSWINETFFNKSDILGFNYYNLSDFNINDYLLISNWNATNNLTFSSLTLEDIGSSNLLTLDADSESPFAIRFNNKIAGDNDYGIYLNNNGVLIFQRQGLGLTASFDQNGNFGIGTATPQNTLNVIGGLNATQNSFFGQNVTIDGTLISGSPLDILGGANINSGNLSVSSGYYYLGDGRFLTNLQLTEADSLAYNGTLAFNSSLVNYYLASNPYSFTNKTLLSQFINDGIFTTWINAMNGTLLSQAVYNANYSGNNFINWAVATNGTLMLQSSYNSNYSSNHLSYLDITNISYYLATNPSSFITNVTMNKSVSCSNLIGSPDSDFCTDATGGGSGVDRMIISGRATASITADEFYHPSGGVLIATDTDESQFMYLPYAGKLHNLSFIWSASQTGRCDLYVRYNASANTVTSGNTALVTSVTSNWHNETAPTLSVSVAKGSSIKIFMDEIGTCSGIPSWSFIYEPT